MAAPADPLDVMSLGEFEPEVWIPSRAGIGLRGTVSLDELASMEVIHGPRRTGARIYDAWKTVLRARQPSFEFIDPPYDTADSVSLSGSSAVAS